MDARRASKQELLSHRAGHMTVEASQDKTNIRYGKAFRPLELSISKKKGAGMLVESKDGRFLSGYVLDSETRRDKFGVSRWRYFKDSEVRVKRRCTSRI